MNEIENRKVLVSFKISTLIIIVLSIIVLSITIAIIVSNISKKDLNNETMSASNFDDEDIISKDIYHDEEAKPTKTIIANVSSRSAIDRIGDNIEFRTQFQQENIEEPDVQTTSIEDVTISKEMDLTVRTGLSKDDFITLISGVEADTSGFFEENAGFIYDMCEKYSVNEIFFCGLISAESGWNISSNHRNSHNYISLMSHNGLIKYSSTEEGLEKAAESLHSKYLSPEGQFYNGPTLAGIKTKFCPSSTTWINLVYQRMEQIIK